MDGVFLTLGLWLISDNYAVVLWCEQAKVDGGCLEVGDVGNDKDDGYGGDDGGDGPAQAIWPLLSSHCLSVSHRASCRIRHTLLDPHILTSHQLDLT